MRGAPDERLTDGEIAIGDEVVALEV